MYEILIGAAMGMFLAGLIFGSWGFAAAGFVIFIVLLLLG